jgi:hypothetical protein
LHVKAHFRQSHLVDGDTLSRFGHDENLVISLGFLALPWKLIITPKRQPALLGGKPGKLLWDLAIEGKLLKLREAQVAKVVVPAHELGLVIGSRKLDVFGFLGQK